MSRYKHTIQELEHANVEDRSKIAERRIAAGRVLYEQSHGAVMVEDTAETRSELEALNERIENAEQKIARIDQITARNEGIKEEVSRARREISRLENEVVPVFEQIGERAFELYRNNDYLENEYTDQFRDLVQRQSEIDEIDHELEELERGSNELPFIKRLVSGGRSTLLRSRRNSKLEGFPKLYRKAGAALCETDFLSTMNDPKLNEIAQPYLAARSRIQQLEDQINELDNERERLRAELHEMDAERRPTRATRELRERVSELNARRNECLGTLTDFVMQSSYNRAALPDETREVLEEIDRLEAEQQKRQEHINRLEAAIEADQVDSEIAQLQQRLSTLRERLSEVQKELESTESSIDEAKQRKEHLLALRGPEEDL